METEMNELKQKIKKVEQELEALPAGHLERPALQQSLAALRQEKVLLLQLLLQQAASASAGGAGGMGMGAAGAGPGPSSEAAAAGWALPGPGNGVGTLDAVAIKDWVKAELRAEGVGAGLLSSVSYEQYYRNQHQHTKQLDISQLTRMLGLALPIPEEQAIAFPQTPQLPGKNEEEVKSMLPGVVKALEAAVRATGVQLYDVHDTHTLRYLEGTAPDITITRLGRVPTSFNAIIVVELQCGELNNCHRGKAMRYCELMLRASPARQRALCVLTNCESMEVYCSHRSEQGHMQYMQSSPVKLSTGRGWDVICQLLERDASTLQLELAPLQLDGRDVSPLKLLGVGRGVIVYHVKHATIPQGMACKVFDSNRATAFGCELAVLTSIREAHKQGLPWLESNSPAPGPGSQAATQHLLLTRPVTTPLEYLTSSKVLHIFDILEHLHTQIKVVHRDVEPKHLAMGLDLDRIVCLLDLGSAAPLSGSRVSFPEASARRYSGTLLFASDDVLTALEGGAQPATPHPRQDVVALVKSACVLVHGALGKSAAGEIAELAEQLAQQPHAPAGAVRMVRSFWGQYMNASTAAGRAWSKLVADAHAIPGIEDEALYLRASKQLCGELAKLVCPG